MGLARLGLLQRLSSLAAPLILIVLAMLSGYVAHSNVITYFVAPQKLELKLLSRQIRESALHTASPFASTLAPGMRYDEFGLPSSAQPWAYKPMINLIKNPANLNAL